MPEDRCARFALILQPEFSLTTLTIATEALRIANQNSGQRLFDWQIVSEDGGNVRASSGLWFAADCDLASADISDVTLLFEGNLPTQHLSKHLLGYLRRAARFGSVVGGLDSAAYALSQTGLVGTETSPEVVLHWEAVPSFREWFPDARPLNRIFQLTQNRAQCAGGIATLDLMLELIARFASEAMANEVANALIHTRRGSHTRQRSDQSFYGEPLKPSARIVSLMKDNLDTPLALEELSFRLNMPSRTMSRICKATFGVSPMRLYLRIRLQAARNFLFYEEHSIKEIAEATGFSYPATFSRCFQNQFGQSPSQFRLRLRQKQRFAEHPEIHRLVESGFSSGG
ncbi:helix-turn-helix domain-containing protein [Labrenzia sp. DG1229]|uniref:GlxA family transcriptional regulator n=1 Tax=Labrenzia sp. DG1229 TaxID=681847 RepID=UPI00155D9685|nr:helix-turn-helix domain-containing protein [Labrenzia sp. DG1229]